jgi:ankyrin repeat protein
MPEIIDMPHFKFDRLYISSQINTELFATHSDKIKEIFSGLRTGANFEKLRGYNLYSARGSDKVRYLCTPYQNSFAIIGILEHHNYNDCSKIFNEYNKSETTVTEFKLDASITFNTLISTITDAPIHEDHAADTAQQDFTKVIFLSDNQDEILTKLDEYRYLNPSFVNGIAGTGKTTIAQYLLQGFMADEKVLYLCPNESLAAAQREQYEMIVKNEKPAAVSLPKINFKSIKEFYQDIGLLKQDAKIEDFSCFNNWFEPILKDGKHPLHQLAKKFLSKETQAQLYNEFKSMFNQQLTENKKSYTDLPVGLSLYDQKNNTRDNVFELCKSYLEYLKRANVIYLEQLGTQLLTPEITEQHTHTQILIDETQLFAYSTLQQMAKLSQNKLVLFGDFNQGKFHFRYQRLLEIFKDLQLLQLNWNFRCSKPVVDLANTILKLQRVFIGGEFESNSIRNMICKRSDPLSHARVAFLDLAEASQLPVNNQTVFITRDEATKQQLIAKYPTQIFTVLLPEQVCGLEFDNVILYNFINQDYSIIAKRLKTQLAKHSQKDNEQIDKIHKPADKTEAIIYLRDIEKFRKLFLVITRARDSICWVEDNNNDFVKQLHAQNPSSNHSRDSQQLIAAQIAKASQSTEVNYRVIADLLNSTDAFEEGLRQVQQYLQQTNNKLVTDISSIINTMRQRNDRFTTANLISIINVKSKAELESLTQTLVIKDIMPVNKAKQDESVDYVNILMQHLKQEMSGQFFSLYHVLAAMGLTLNGSLYTNVSSIKNLIFNTLPSPKKSGKAKETAQNQQKILAETSISKKNYMEENVTINSEMRQTELQTFAEKSDTAIVLLDSRGTGKQAIQCYNINASNIIVLLQNAQNQFKRITATSEKLQLIKQILQKFHSDTTLDDAYAFEMALKYDLTLQQVPADGHCLYHSIAAFQPIYDNIPVQNYQTLRDLVAEEIENNSELKNKVEGEFAPYLVGIKGTTWGGELEIKALSLKLNCPIVVFSTTIVQPLVYGDDLPNQPIFLAYNGINHYNFLKPNNDDANAVFAKIKTEYKTASSTVTVATVSLSKSNDKQKQKKSTVCSPITPSYRHAQTRQRCSMKQDDSIALILAAQNGHIAMVNTLIAAGADINAIGQGGCTALMAAARNGHIKIVKTLIAAGADVNVVSQYSGTALMDAAVKGCTEIVKALIAAGADVNATAHNHLTALMIAAVKGSTEIVKALIAAKVDVNAVEERNWTALMVAAQNGHTATVDALIAAKVDINAVDASKWTALMIAAQKGHTATVHALIAAGADIHVVGHHDVTAIKLAVQMRHAEIMHALINAVSAQSSVRSKIPTQQT